MNMLGAELWKMVASEIVISGVLVKGAALAGALVLLELGLRRASAATRSAVWTAAFSVLAVLPLLLPVLAGRVAPVFQVGVAEFPEQLFEPAGATSGTGATGWGLPVAAWLALAWAAGALLLLARFVLHLIRIRLVTRRAAPAGGALSAAARRAEAALGVSGVRVMLSDTPGVPLTWGVRRPVILLPTEARDWPEELQRAVVHHEMAHVARRDYLGLVAMEIARALHWPNPLVWHLLNKARMDQERACDDAAIRSGIAASDYARHLVAVARSFSLGSAGPLAALPIVRGSTLRTRVHAVMRREASRRPATAGTVLGSLLLVGALAVPVAGSSVWICPQTHGASAGDEPAAVATRFAGAASQTRASPEAPGLPSRLESVVAPAWPSPDPLADSGCDES